MKKILLISLAVMLTLSAFTFTSCGWLVEEIASAMAAPQGYVYNAEDGSNMVGATVELKNTAGVVVYSAISNSNGYYAFSDIEYGTFELTASYTGYVFTKQVVEVSGLNQTLPNIGGFVSGGEVFRIVVFWDRDFADVDSYLSMPDVYPGQAIVDSGDFYNTSSSPDVGFFPADSGRQIISSYNTEIVDGDIIAQLDVDNVGDSNDVPGGPESISVFWFPFLDGGSSVEYTPVDADRSGLDTSLTYAWVGTMEYYLDAWAAINNNIDGNAVDEEDALLSSATIDGVAANPVVYIFDDNGEQKAYFTLPLYQNIETASIIRINMFYGSDGNEYYQFLPQVQVYMDFNSIRSLEDEGSSVFAIKGKKRN